jgi:hypothetical protein
MTQSHHRKTLIRQRMTQTGESYRSAKQWLEQNLCQPPSEGASSFGQGSETLLGGTMTDHAMERDKVLSRAIDGTTGEPLDLATMTEDEKNTYHELYKFGLEEGLRRMAIEKQGGVVSFEEVWPERKQWIAQFNAWANRRETELNERFTNAMAAGELKVTFSLLTAILHDRSRERPRDRWLKQTAELFGCSPTEFNPNL